MFMQDFLQQPKEQEITMHVMAKHVKEDDGENECS